MKKFLSICLCAALLTGGFGGGLSAFAAKTSTEVTSTDEILYPASDTPDKINEEGQKAINAQFYTTEDGVKVEPTAIGCGARAGFSRIQGCQLYSSFLLSTWLYPTCRKILSDYR